MKSIENIVENLLFRYPLFGQAIANLDFKHVKDNIPAAAYTDGKTIFYKDEFFEYYTEEEQEFLIAHEIFHIVLQHVFRDLGKDIDLLNYVADAIINQMLVRDGLTMPKGLVNEPDALEYSVDELYMKFLPRINEIKEWMGENTYHIDIEDILNEVLEKFREERYKKDLKELMNENSKVRRKMVKDYQSELEISSAKGSSNAPGFITKSYELPAVEVGEADPLLEWQRLLEGSLKSEDDTINCFYEVDSDGILRKEEKDDYEDKESEIVIDTSGSMSITKIKAILRECKNILYKSKLKVGFCDDEFHGWHPVYTPADIDKLRIAGREGTSFYAMAEAFSEDALNKVVITDGLGVYPPNVEGILWIIINTSMEYPEIHLKGRNDVNYIFIDENTLTPWKKGKSLNLTTKANYDRL